MVEYPFGPFSSSDPDLSLSDESGENAHPRVIVALRLGSQHCAGSSEFPPFQMVGMPAITAPVGRLVHIVLLFSAIRVPSCSIRSGVANEHV